VVKYSTGSMTVRGSAMWDRAARSSSSSSRALAGLTGRERDILALIAEGRSNHAICERLYLSPKTVETHVGSIFAKLGLLPAADDHRRVLAVLMYVRNA
jgi:DNA-binding NarL/FixJ family response regulator